MAEVGVAAGLVVMAELHLLRCQAGNHAYTVGISDTYDRYCSGPVLSGRYEFPSAFWQKHAFVLFCDRL